MRTAMLAGAIALVAGAGAARAQPSAKATCQAIEIAATNGKAPSIPDDLKSLEKKLKKPPLAAWNSFRVMSSSSVTLEGMKPASPKLASGATTIMLRDVDQKGGKRPRLSLGITMDGASGKRVFDSKVGIDTEDWVVYGETLENNDGHFVALTCHL